MPGKTTWYLHGERPNGAHCWHPFSTWREFVNVVERLCAIAPDDTTWNCTRTTQVPEEETNSEAAAA